MRLCSEYPLLQLSLRWSVLVFFHITPRAPHKVSLDVQGLLGVSSPFKRNSARSEEGRALQQTDAPFAVPENQPDLSSPGTGDKRMSVPLVTARRWLGLHPEAVVLPPGVQRCQMEAAHRQHLGFTTNHF